MCISTIVSSGGIVVRAIASTATNTWGGGSSQGFGKLCRILPTPLVFR